MKGKCPVFKAGDIFYLEDGYKLSSKIPVCMHSLASIMPYYNALSKGITPDQLGLGTKEKGYFQCLDPCIYTGGGTVIFEIKREDE